MVEVKASSYGLLLPPQHEIQEMPDLIANLFYIVIAILGVAVIIFLVSFLKELFIGLFGWPRSTPLMREVVYVREKPEPEPNFWEEYTARKEREETAVQGIRHQEQLTRQQLRNDREALELEMKLLQEKRLVEIRNRHCNSHASEETPRKVRRLVPCANKNPSREVIRLPR